MRYTVFICPHVCSSFNTFDTTLYICRVLLYVSLCEVEVVPLSPQILINHNNPFLYIKVLLNHRIPKVKKMFGKIMNVNEITDEYMEVWIMYFEAFWLFNVFGEAIPQLIIRLIYPLYKILLHDVTDIIY